MSSISSLTSMGVVTLDVANLDLMTKFYRDGIGLTVLAEERGGSVVLGRENSRLVVLRHNPGLKHAGPSDAGLFHTAVLFAERSALAAAVVETSRMFPHSFTGSADHLVSEAFYFDDPEGNGVELYWDRPRENWVTINGQIQMDTVYLDPSRFVESHFSEKDLAGHGSSTVSVGHVHLSVGDIQQAHDFYVSQIGFDQTFSWDNQALFVSAGGYHHHMAMNIWRSRGAGLRQPALGLGAVDIVMPDDDDRALVVDRLRHFHHDVRDDGKTVSVDDPWGNTVNLVLAG